jgi:hypothetical protein
LIGLIDDRHGGGVELLGLDKGPGIADLGKCLQDGYSTGGSPGTGLGAISRLAQKFEIYSRPGQGTALLARLQRKESRNVDKHLSIGSVVVPKAGEQVCGDTWCYTARPNGFTVLGVDGLGHGHHAALAAAEACKVFDGARGSSPAEILRRMHEILRPTRGAAVLLVDVDWSAASACAAGIGNLVAALAQSEGTKRIISDNGIVGHTASKFREIVYPCAEDAVLIMHSDGLSGSWQLEKYPGLLQHDPSLIAAVLYRDFTRVRDDSMIVVIKRADA